MSTENIIHKSKEKFLWSNVQKNACFHNLFQNFEKISDDEILSLELRILIIVKTRFFLPFALVRSNVYIC